MFEFVEGVMRWTNRVIAYAFVLVTDRYPPFSLGSSGDARAAGVDSRRGQATRRDGRWRWSIRN